MQSLQNYTQMAVTTQSQGRLVVMLYEGAIRFLRQARIAIVNKDYAKRNYNIQRAQEIVFELNASLNMELGGEISKRLRSLYTFIWARLNQVNLKNDVVLLDRLTSILDNLAGAWRQISMQ